MLLKDLISQFISIELKEKGYIESFEKITNIAYRIKHTKDNIQLLFSVEEMENDFTFKIVIKTGKTPYCISDKEYAWEYYDSFKKDANMKYKNIFEFIDGNINKEEFEKRRDYCFKKAANWFSSNKHLKELMVMYKELIMASIDKIEEFAQTLN